MTTASQFRIYQRHVSTNDDSLEIAAVCRGSWTGKPWSSDCLVLNLTSNKWKRGVLGGVLHDIVLDVFKIDFKTYVREGFK